MSEVKRFVVDMQGRGEECVLSSDYDALAAERDDLAERYSSLRICEDGLVARVVSERDAALAELENCRLSWGLLKTELAALKGGQSEPVAWQHKKPTVNDSGETVGYSTWKDGKGLDHWPHRPLYTAPPAQASAWVPVSDLTPADDSEPVWCWGTYERQYAPCGFEGVYRHGRWVCLNNGDYIDGGYGDDYEAQVSHWMPIPAAPTPGASDGKEEA